MKNQNSYFSKRTIIHNDVKYEHPVRTIGAVSIKADCIIDSFTYINSNTTIKKGTKIGKYCSIGRNCEIGAYDHPMEWLSSSPIAYNLKFYFPEYKESFKQKKVIRPKETTIGNDVWIGSSVIIKRGLKIGNGAVIAGGAVVISDVPDYAIYGGVPAKFIKYRFEESIRKELTELNWWDIDYKLLNNIDFNDIENAIIQVKKIKEKSKPKINFFLNKSDNYNLVEKQLQDLIINYLDKGEYTISDKKNSTSINISFFIRNDVDVVLSHGVADKNYFWISDENKDKYVNRLKAVMVPGKWHKNRLLKSKKITLEEDQIIIVGWPRIDLLRNLQKDIFVPTVNNEIRICWAPTHDVRKRGESNESTSSYPEFEIYAKELEKNYIVEYALHPRNSKDKKPTMEKLLSSNIVISDFGTMVYEAWALNKPVIFPRWILKNNIEKYLPYSAEAYIMEKKIGYHPESFEEMIEIIEKGPVISSDVKNFMSNYLDNYNKGNSSKKIANELKKLYFKHIQN